MGHGNHWQAISGDTEKAYTHWIPTILAKGKLTDSKMFDFSDGESLPREEKAVGIVYPETPLRFLALVATDSVANPPTNVLFSTYPLLFEGCPNSIKIDSVEDWGDPVEGIISGGTEGGAEVSFFDPFYFLNKSKYQIGTSYSFVIAALAYSLQKCETDEIEVTEGALIQIERERVLKESPDADVSKISSVSLSLRNACWLFPTGVKDDCEFRGIPKEVKSFEVDGAHFFQIKLTLTRPEDIDFDVMLYVSEPVLGDYRPKVGEAVEGFLWLQGHLT